MANRAVTIRWFSKPQDHDYPAAVSYLSLIYEPKAAKAIVRRLKQTRTVEFRSKDIFRASELSLLGVSNFHVAKDERKIASGERLSPLLLVRDPAHGKVVIADGYHRLCAVYSRDEDAVIPCRIV